MTDHPKIEQAGLISDMPVANPASVKPQKPAILRAPDLSGDESEAEKRAIRREKAAFLRDRKDEK